MWTTVNSSGDFATKIELTGGDAARAWLNGSAIANPASAAVEIKKGVNKLLIEVKYSGASKTVTARFLDPDRRLIHE